ncbi:hypothetical protein QUF74_11220 [Candidatus Halobeggiatoa sp. HSG11]|nr:hypothetical protein [Candidatus Halobeggiatoa sp. HSG11]
MKTGLRYILQTINYSIFMLIVWYFSVAPAYTHLDVCQSVVVLAFGHAGQSVSKCRKRTPEELAALPPNMRNPMICPRERSPIEVELLLDDKLLFTEIFNPQGVSGDWGVDVYRRFNVPSGKHNLKMRLKDSVRVKDFNYIYEVDVDLKAAQLLTIDFQPEKGGFSVR